MLAASTPCAAVAAKKVENPLLSYTELKRRGRNHSTHASKTNALSTALPGSH